MDYNAITTLIGSLGFPVVMCIMMYRQMIKQTDQHTEEMLKLNEAINNNTQAITMLSEKIDKEIVTKPQL